MTGVTEGRLWVLGPPGPVRERLHTMLDDLVHQLLEVADHPGWRTLLSAQLASAEARTNPEGESLGPTDPTNGRLPRALPDWAEAVTTVANREGLRYELAHARIRWAQQLLGTGDRDTARHQLHAAFKAIDTLRAEPLGGSRCARPSGTKDC